MSASVRGLIFGECGSKPWSSPTQKPDTKTGRTDDANFEIRVVELRTDCQCARPVRDYVMSWRLERFVDRIYISEREKFDRHSLCPRAGSLQNRLSQ